MRAQRSSYLILFLVTVVMIVALRFMLPAWQLLPPWLDDMLAVWRQAAVERLQGLSLQDEQEGLLRAMVLGDRKELSPFLRGLYAQSGASHVLALSGLHLSILFCVPAFFHRFMATMPWLHRCSALCMLAVLWLYVCLAGASPSLLRAAIMLSVLYIQRMRDFGGSYLYALIVSFLLILLCSPASLYSVSFQLSYAAVMGIFLFYSPLSSQLRLRSRPLSWLWKSWCATLAAMAGSAPLAAYYFHSFSPSAILLSPIYIFLATAIIYVGVGGLVFGVGAGVVAWLMDVQHALMQATLNWPGASVGNFQFSVARMLLCYVCLLLFLPPLRAFLPRYPDTIGNRNNRLVAHWPYLLAAVAVAMVASLV